MQAEVIQLEAGKTLIEYGPISAVIIAYEGNRPINQGQACVDVMTTILGKLARDLEVLRKPLGSIENRNLTGISRTMLESVQITGDVNMTPMAAVAGTVADIIADWLFDRGLSKVIVNNGGDIALRLAPQESVLLGISRGLSRKAISDVIEIKGNQGIGGIATSGLGGRSFTLGIAESLTVLSQRCSVADALATHIANKSCIDSLRVHRKKAKELDSTTDIGELLAVTHVEKLHEDEIKRSLQQIEVSARYYMKHSWARSVYGTVQGRHIDIL